MCIVRRLSLAAFVLIAPPFVCALLYMGTQLLLQASHRIIAPQFLWYAAVVELPIFLLVAVLEAKSRW